MLIHKLGELACFQVLDLYITFFSSLIKLTNVFLYQAESGGPAIVSRRSTGQAGAETFVMKIPNNKVREFLCVINFFVVIWFSTVLDSVILRLDLLLVNEGKLLRICKLVLLLVFRFV